MSRTITVGIVGVGGFGRRHLETILGLQETGSFRLVAAVIRSPEKYRATETDLRRRGVRIYRGYEEMFHTERGGMALAVIPGGIDQHKEQSLRALKAGYDVLCEKPVAGTVDEARQMQAEALRTGRRLAICFQSVYSPQIQRIKEISAAGTLGRLIKAKMVAALPRSTAYYRRNAWAGRIRFGDAVIYDSPLQNPMAHYLNNMLYIAGPERNESADLEWVYGENYRTKPIESADTQFIRIRTRGGVELVGMGTHAATEKIPPRIELTYEKGAIEWVGPGHTTVYEACAGQKGIVETCRAEQGEAMPLLPVYQNLKKAMTEGTAPLCTVQNAIQHTAAINALFSSSPVHSVPEEYVKRYYGGTDPYDGGLDLSDEDFFTEIADITATLNTMFQRESSFHQAGRPWAVPGKAVHLD